MAGYGERDVVLRDDRKIEAPSNASSFVLFSPRPHRQLAASSVISFESGDANCRVAGPGEISRDRSSEETFRAAIRSWGVSQWLREKKKKRRDKCSSASAGRYTETLRKEKEKNKTALSFAFLFFSPPSLVLFSSLLSCLPSSKKLKPFSLYPLPLVKNHLQATELTRPPPVSLTAGNKSFPWQLRSWLPPNKNTTVGALGRAVGSVANSSNPLNATKAVAQGLALYKQETKALILGQAGIVSFVNSVNTSASAGSPIRCFVDPSTGQLVGLEQAGLTACSPTGDVTVVPASAGYISQIKLAYTYDGAFVGRLVFDLKANATAKPVSYTCGSAGGKAVDLLPSKGAFVVTKLGVGCAPLPSVAAGTGGASRPGTLDHHRRRRRARRRSPIDPGDAACRRRRSCGERPDQAAGPQRRARRRVAGAARTPRFLRPHGLRGLSPSNDGPSAPVVTPSLARLRRRLGDAGDPRGELRPDSCRQRRDPEQRDREFDFVCLGDVFDRRLRDAAEPRLSLGLGHFLRAIERCASPGRKRRDPRVDRGRDRRLFCGASRTTRPSPSTRRGLPLSLTRTVATATKRPFKSSWARPGPWLGPQAFLRGTHPTRLSPSTRRGRPLSLTKTVATAPERPFKSSCAGTWTVVGTAGFSAGQADYTSLALDSTGTPFVAYQDSANNFGATVQKLVGGSWTVVGTAGFSAGQADYTSLALDSTGTPFVAYQDSANGDKATVQKLVSGTWTVVGTAGFSAGQADYTSLALDSTGTPFVAYTDNANSNGATVQKLVAGSWTVVGTAGFSAGQAVFTSLALDSTGTPFVAYR